MRKGSARKENFLVVLPVLPIHYCSIIRQDASSRRQKGFEVSRQQA